MTILFKILGIAFVTIAIYSIIKNTQSQLGNLLIVAAGALILLLLADPISDFITTLTSLNQKTGVSGTVFSVLLKIIGIGYLTEYSVALCEDSGCSALGKKIELGGKITILVSSIPIINQIITMIEELL